MARYLPSNVPLSTAIKDLQRWLRAEFARVRSSTDDIYRLFGFLLDNFAVAGYGQIGLDAVTPLANINATWQQLPFDVELIAQPRGVTYNIAGDGMALDVAGVWEFFAKVSLEFTDTNDGRRMELTLWDTVNNVPIGPLFNFSIGRNTDGANLNFQIMFDVADGFVEPLGLAVRSQSDTFTGVSAIGSIYGVSYQSEYKGDFELEAGRNI